MKKSKKLTKKTKVLKTKKLIKKSSPTKKKIIVAKSKKVAPKVIKSNDRIGLYGGAFNPVHLGHLNAALSVKQQFDLTKVYFVPTFKAPHRDITGLNAQQRSDLLNVAIENYKDELAVSDIEIQRKGISFTVDTLKEFNKTHKPENIYFIMGVDAFKNFHTWRDFDELLKLANFIITTRPGTTLSFYDLPNELEEALKKHIKQTDLNKLTLKSKRELHLLEIEDINASSTEIRKRLRSGGEVKHMVPPQVLEVIKQRGYYQRSIPAVKDYKEFAKFCLEAALDKKALSSKIYDMTRLNNYSDFSVICSGTSTRHTVAVAENIIDKVKEEFGLHPIGFEGSREGRWVLVDYGPVVIHVFEDAERLKYKIEELWKSCPQLQ